jgi:excisionase family DNA binding protein
MDTIDRSRHNDLDELLTLGEVAELLRVPDATLRYWRHRGTGPESFKIGRHVRYRRSDVRAWLHHQQSGGAA